MDLKIKNKVFLVAASSKGLGYGIARELASNGAIVYIGSRTKEHVDSAIQKLRTETNSEVHGSVIDASDPQSIKMWFQNASHSVQHIDGLVVNAGGPPPGGFSDFTDEDWSTAFNLTLMSSVRMIRETLPYLHKSDGGSILTITSGSVKEPINGLLLSNVFRAGVVSLVKSLANELAGDNIRVNNLIPGRIDTDRVKALDQNLAQIKNLPVEKIKEHHLANIPCGRYGTIEEFGKAGAFLLSDAASYITGTSLVVDGGLLKSIM